MRNLMAKLWADDQGIVTVEYLVLGTFLALALIVGVTTLAAAINAEVVELGNAILSFSQAYSANGTSSCVAQKAGSAATDTCGNSGLTFPPAEACPVNVNNCP